MICFDETEEAYIGELHACFLCCLSSQAVNWSFILAGMPARNRQTAPNNVADKDFPLIEAETVRARQRQLRLFKGVPRDSDCAGGPMGNILDHRATVYISLIGRIRPIPVALAFWGRMTRVDPLRSFANRPESKSLLRRNAYFAAIVVVQFLGCVGAERENPLPHTAADIRTHYVVTGSGEPVVLVHGFSQTHAAWVATPLYEDLVRDHTVIAVDLRGHGDSDKPHDPMAYGPNMQSDLVKLLDLLEVDRAHFVGFSLGASIVGDLVVSSPERVRTATMGSGYFTTWDETEERFARMTENRAAADEQYPWEPENQDYRALAAVIRGASI